MMKQSEMGMVCLGATAGVRGIFCPLLVCIFLLLLIFVEYTYTD